MDKINFLETGREIGQREEGKEAAIRREEEEGEC